MGGQKAGFNPKAVPEPRTALLQEESVAFSVEELRRRHGVGRGDREGKLRAGWKYAFPQLAGNRLQPPLQPHLHGKERREAGSALLPQSSQEVPGLPASPSAKPGHRSRSPVRAALTPQR